MTHASVFSGIGGPEVAATLLGWKNLFHCEINPFGKRVLDYWYPNAESYDDITTTDFTKWRGRVNVLTGGFPCQPFSYAGQRRGADDDRYLWPSMYRAIDEIQPDWVVAENVAGILTMVEQGEVSPMANQASLFDEDDGVHRYQLRETFTLQRICQDLETHGYAVQPILIPACAVGAPHRRDRVFIVAHSNRNRGSEVDEYMESEVADGAEPFGNGRERNAADTSHAGLQEARSEQQPAGIGRHALWSGEWLEGFQDLEVAGCNRWSGFPSVSPVHRGNDGLPFNVDDLTLSLGKWRNESIKAYGNAIVPQVMYEIFRAIEITEETLF